MQELAGRAARRLYEVSRDLYAPTLADPARALLAALAEARASPAAPPHADISEHPLPYPAESSSTPQSARNTPAPWVRVSRSDSTTRPSSTVATG